MINRQWRKRAAALTISAVMMVSATAGAWGVGTEASGVDLVNAISGWHDTSESATIPEGECEEGQAVVRFSTQEAGSRRLGSSEDISSTVSLPEGCVLEDTVTAPIVTEDGSGETGSGTISLKTNGSAVDEGTMTFGLVSSDRYDTAELIEQLQGQTGIAYAEPNYTFKLCNYPSYSLDDEYASSGYQLNTDKAVNDNGDQVNDRGYGDDLRAMNTSVPWEKSENTGRGKETVVAVIDSGIDVEHEDLKNRLWTNPGTSALSFLGEHGYNCVEDCKDITDEVGHGTHIAGIITAEADNKIGIAGVAGKANVKVMGFRIMSDITATSFYAINALSMILKAKQNGVNIVATNNSWGNNLAEKSTALRELFDQHGDAGILTFFASGNDANDIDSQNFSPITEPSDYKVVVGAVGEAGKATPYSNYGVSTVDLYAPGTNILSTVSTNTYFPALYDPDRIYENTEYYGEFSADTQISGEEGNQAVTPVLGDNGKGRSYEGKANPFGASIFYAPEGSKATCSLSIDTENYMCNSSKPASLKVTIDNIEGEETYGLFFPYTKEEGTTRDNASLSVLMKNSWKKGDCVGTLSARDMCIKNGKLEFVGEDEEEVCSVISDESQNNEYVHISGKHVASNKEVKGAESYGLGVAFTNWGIKDEKVGGNRSMTFYIEALGITKKNADETQFGKYNIMSGTSMACPAAAGAAALLSTIYPKGENESGSEYAMKLKGRLFSSLEKDDDFTDLCSTGGRIDLSRMDSKDPSLLGASTDLSNEDDVTITLRGYQLHGDQLLTSRKTSVSGAAKVSIPLNSDTVPESGMYAVCDENSETIVIHRAKELVGARTEFTVTDPDDPSCFGRMVCYPVRGEKKWTKLREEFNISSKIVYQVVSDGKHVYGIDNHYNAFRYDSNKKAMIRYSGKNFDKTLKASKVYKAITKSVEVEEAACVQQTKPIIAGGNVIMFVDVAINKNKDYAIMARLPLSISKPTWQFVKIADSVGVAGTQKREICEYNGKLYVVGGDSPTQKTYCFDLNTYKWTRATNLPVKLICPSLVSTGRYLYAVAGTTQACGEIYDKLLRFDGKTWKTMKAEVPKAYRGYSSRDYYGKFFMPALAPADEGFVMAGTTLEGLGDTVLYRESTDSFEPLYYTMDNGLGQETPRTAALTSSGMFVASEVAKDEIVGYDLMFLKSRSDTFTCPKAGSVQFLKKLSTLRAGKKHYVMAQAKGTDRRVTYKSSNAKYATVNKAGVVKAKAAGKGKTVTITATSTANTSKKATIKIKIK